MNRQQSEQIKQSNLKKLDTESFTPNINTVSFNPFSESPIHILGKTIIYMNLKLGVPLEILKKYESDLLTYLFDSPRKFFPYFIKYKNKKQIPEIATEARFKNQRRADIFILSSPNRNDVGKCIEIETNKRISKDGNETVTFYI